MDEATKEITAWMTSMIGHILLWGSLFIGFISWTYSMGFFRVSIMGVVLIATGHYLKMKWNINEQV